MDNPESPKFLVEQGAKAVEVLTGGAMNEMSKLLGQNVALWRFKNAVDIAVKAQGFLSSRGISTDQLTPELRNIVPLLEYSSYEDNPSLQEMWSSLLATSVMPEFESVLRPKYSEFLKQLSPSEARMLQYIYTNSGYEGSDKAFSYVVSDKSKINREEMCLVLGIDPEPGGILLRNLFRLSLIDGKGAWDQGTVLRECYITDLGLGFMRRCTYFFDQERL